MTMPKFPVGKKLTPANEAGQMPPTPENPVRQRYQMGCHGGAAGSNSGSSSAPRTKVRSKQFNRGGGY